MAWIERQTDRQTSSWSGLAASEGMVGPAQARRIQGMYRGWEEGGQGARKPPWHSQHLTQGMTTVRKQSFQHFGAIHFPVSLPPTPPRSPGFSICARAPRCLPIPRQHQTHMPGSHTERQVQAPNAFPMLSPPASPLSPPASSLSFSDVSFTPVRVAPRDRSWGCLY